MSKKIISIVAIFSFGFATCTYVLGLLHQPDSLNPIGAWKGAGLTIKAILLNELPKPATRHTITSRPSHIDLAHAEYTMVEDLDPISETPRNEAQKEMYLIEEQAHREIEKVHLKGFSISENRNIAAPPTDQIAWLKKIEQTDRNEITARTKTGRLLKTQSDEDTDKSE